MKLFIISILFSLSVKSQDTAITYTRVFVFDSLTKDKIFDKVLIWTSKAFNDSKHSINVSSKESGILSGKALLVSNYKIPKKKDSTMGYFLTDYTFNWLIEIKDQKLRLSVSEIVVDGTYKVSSNTNAPLNIGFQSKSKTDLQWKLTKEYFLKNLNGLAEDMYYDVAKKDEVW